jgi:isopentenyl-diphosphate delta-isomerase
MTRESTLVELVDADGAAVGQTTVALAHTAPGQLHRAFSVLLVDPDGRLLLQQRAAGKTRFALRWANACCGHPAPGQSVVDAASRRLAEELGLRSIALTPVGVYVYRASDPISQLVEHEYDHVLVGHLPTDPTVRPDPAEVAALRWADPVRLRDELVAAAWSYAPWLAGVVSVWESAGVEPSGGR